MKPATRKALKDYYQFIVDLVKLNVTALVNFEYTDGAWEAISCSTLKADIY